MDDNARDTETFRRPHARRLPPVWAGRGRASWNRLWIAAAAAALGAGPGRVGRAADVTSTWVGTGAVRSGVWGTTALWANDPAVAQFPNDGNGGLSYNAVITAGYPDLDRDITVQRLTLSGSGVAGISGPYNLTLTEGGLWTGGTMGGNLAGTGATTATTLVAAGADLTVTGADGLLVFGLAGRILRNAGTIRFDGGALGTRTSVGQIQTEGASAVVNEAGGLFEVSGGNGFFATADGTSATFDNAGTFRKTGPGTTEFVNWPFNNRGVVRVEGGTLRPESGGASSGVFDVSAGATLQFGGFSTFGSGGTHSLLPGSRVRGAGRVFVSQGATLNVGGGYDVAETRLTGSGATLNVDAAATTGSFTVTGGTLGGAGSLTVVGTTSTWTGGTMTGGSTNVALGATVTIPTGIVILDGRTLNNSGLLKVTGNIGGTGVVNNQTGATLELTGAATVNVAAVNNAGTILRPANSGGIPSVYSLNNGGTVMVEGGSLLLYRGGTHAGRFHVSPGALLDFSGTHSLLPTARFVGAGLVRFSDGTITVSGPLAVETLSVGRADLTVQPGAALAVRSMSVTGQNTITVAGGAAGGGVLEVGPGGLTFPAAGDSQRKILLSGDPAAPGRLVLSGNVAVRGGTAAISTSTFGTPDDGVLDLGGAVRTFTVNGVGLPTTIELSVGARIVNGGIVKEGAGSMQVANPGNAFGGGITVNGGTLDLNRPQNFTGGVRANARGPSFGTLQVSADAQLGAPSNDVALAGGALQANGTFSSARRVVLGDAAANGEGTIGVRAGDTLTLTAPIVGLAGLVKAGAGTLRLDAAAGYAGQTRIAAGALRLGSGGGIGSSYLVTVDTLATLDLGGNNTTIRALNGAGTVDLGGGTLTVNDNGSATTFAGAIGGGGGVAKAGPGSLSLTGNNCFAGGLTVNGGSVVLAGPSTFGGGLRVNAGAAVAASADAHLGAPANAIALSGGTLRAGGSFATARAVSVAAGGGGTIEVVAGAAATSSGTVSGPGPLTKAGAGLLQLTADSPLSGAVTVQAGTVAFAGPGGAARAVAQWTVATGAGLELDNRSGANGNRVGDVAVLTGRGGAVSLFGADATASSESVCPLSVVLGVTNVIVDAGTGGGTAELRFSALVRSPGAIVRFRSTANDLGGSERIYLGNRAAGVIGSWAQVDLGDGRTDLAAYDPVRGVVPRSQYIPSAFSTADVDSPAVPEPAVVGLLAAAAVGGLGRRRRSGRQTDRRRFRVVNICLCNR